MFEATTWPKDLPTCVPVNPIQVQPLRKVIEHVKSSLDAQPHRVRPEYPFKDETPSQWWKKFLDTESANADEQCRQCKDLRTNISTIHDRSVDSKDERKSKREKKTGLVSALRNHRSSGQCLDVNRLRAPISSLLTTDPVTRPQLEEKKILVTPVGEAYSHGESVPFPIQLYDGRSTCSHFLIFFIL